MKAESTMRATQASWKTLPAPSERAPLLFDANFTDTEAEQIMLGLLPGDMSDKWFIYFADGWLNFHRSWTGRHIYALRLEESTSGGMKVVESWVNRDPNQYPETSLESDREFVQCLIDAYLLKKIGITKSKETMDSPEPKT